MKNENYGTRRASAKQGRGTPNTLFSALFVQAVLGAIQKNLRTK